MAQGTAIEWTHRPGTIPATMNALVGCQKVSAGCAHCYAIEVAHLRAGNPLPVIQEKFAGTTRVDGGKRVWTGKVTLSEKALLAPLRWKKSRTIFVNALSDLFYEGVPDEWIDRHFAVFALCPQHTFIVLTKRPERMLAYLKSRNEVDDSIWHQADVLCGDFGYDEYIPSWPLANVWIGVSVEDQKTADERIPLLLQTPAAVRFVSAEPLLGAMNIGKWTGAECHHEESFSEGDTNATICRKCEDEALLDWVIVGGESGPGARPMHPDWARSLRDQCKAAGVPFFFKQWGEWLHVAQVEETRTLKCSVQYFHDLESSFACVGKKAAGHLLDGVEHHAFPAGGC